ncbi:MAG: hypothetical protein AABY07_08965 [Nanoarchaeota archaeon]
MVIEALRAILSVDDAASQHLNNIRESYNKLVDSTQKITSSFSQLNSTILALGGATGIAGPQIQQLGKDLARIQTSGKTSSTQLINLAARAEVLSDKGGNLSQVLHTLSLTLQEAASQMKNQEQISHNLSGTWGIATDAAAHTAQQFRAIASGTQGLMLGMAILQRNVMGAAFSLIFLQFIARRGIFLAVTGLTVAIGATVFAITKLINTGRNIKQLSDALFVATRNAQGLDIIKRLASDISESLGGGFTTELTNFLTQLRLGGIGYTDKDAGIIGGIVAAFLSVPEVFPGIKSLDDLRSKIEELNKEGIITEDLFKRLAPGVAQSLEEVNKLNLDPARLELRKTKEELGKLLEPLAIEINKFWNKFKLEFYRGAISTLDFIKIVFKIIFNDADLITKIVAFGTLIAGSLFIGIVGLFISEEKKKELRNSLDTLIVTLVKEGPIAFFKAIGNAIGAYLVDGIKQWIKDFGNITDIISDIFNIVTLKSEMKEEGKDLGIEYTNGILDGLDIGKPLIEATLEDIRKTIMRILRLGFSSPSSKDDTETQGLSTDGINKSTSRLSGNLTPDLGNRSGGNINLIVNVSGTNLGNPKETGDIVAARILSGIGRHGVVMNPTFTR